MKQIILIQRIWVSNSVKPDTAFECELIVKGQKEPLRNVEAILLHENEVVVWVTPEFRIKGIES
jgi:hypothetical protein